MEAEAPGEQQEAFATLDLRRLQEEEPYPNPGGAEAVGGGATWQELPWWRDAATART